MTQHRQQFDQGRDNGRRNSFRPAKVCWVISLSVGLCFAQLSPVLARHPFNSPMVPRAALPRVVSPAPPVRRAVRPVAPVHRFSRRPAVVRHSFPVRRVLRALPLGYAAIMLANNLYYYNAGSFYRKDPGGYVVVDAPVGAVVPALPAGYSFLYVDGVRYCTHAGSYYLQVPGGYQVVLDPRRSVPQSVVSNKVVVTSKVLNVRSGPSLQYYIANKAYYGEVLQVLSRERDWVYVQLPDNSRGWVMTRFTEPARQRADG
ncbi:SH3 domain-containing protein [Candidatus Electrothrix aarhusensis]|uniref:SH3 domain-containing protein n=1 Tax=Candidatus Electrothrix aarhusensis TaxID=1859131 RepID=A0A444J2C1_9BACT|nr:SH3 domain-containing protein [Candidatus Electrothrix aarhusensis]